MKICVISYGCIVEHQGAVYTNPAIASLINHLAKRYEVSHVAVAASRDSSVYNDGKPIYTQKIADSVKSVKLLPRGGSSGLRRLLVFLRNTRSILKGMTSSDLAYIFLPSYTNLMAASLALIAGKKYSLYIGVDWKALGQMRRDALIVNAVLRKIQDSFLCLVYDRARFILVTGREIYGELIGPGRNVFQTIPSVSFKDCGSQNLEPVNRKNGAVNLLFVGVVNKRKGVVYLVKALSRLEAKGMGAHLHLVGSIDAKYSVLLDQEIKRGALSRLVTFHGYMSDPVRLSKLYRESDVLVIPSLAEGFPRVIYEAMMSKVPVIASDLPSIRGNLDGWDCVYFVPTKDPEAIANAVCEVARDADLRRRMVENGLEFVLTKVPKREHYEQVEDLIDRFA